MKNYLIISRDNEPFTDRGDAGKTLAEEMTGLKGENIVVLGILRGGIVVAAEIARNLNAEIDIVLSRKIGAPMNPELAIGAISENGKQFINQEIAQDTGADQEFINEETLHEMVEIKRRREIFRKLFPKVNLLGKTTIITDDGIATGATMQAAVWSVREEHPEKIIVAVPVAPESTVKKLAMDTDEVLCLKAPYYFNAIGNFYLNFQQVEDDEVLETLKAFNIKNS